MRDEALERDFALVQQCVTKLREVRARYGVPPSARLPVTVRADEAEAEVVTRLKDQLTHMSGAGEVVVDASAEKPKDAALAVVGSVELLVHGVVDVEKEKQKLDKEKGKLAGRITGLENKLGNEGFVAKAPPEVVEKSRAELAELREQMRRIEEALADL
jgi:valyl-tRNA synthetase